MVNVNIERMRANPSLVVRHLRELDLSLLEDAMRIVARGFEWEGFYQQGETIIRQGTPGDAMFIIDEGNVRVERRKFGLGALFVLAILGQGKVFGEIALVRDTLRTADVVALSDVALLRLSKERWNYTRAMYPLVGLRLEQIADGRLQQLVTLQP